MRRWSLPVLASAGALIGVAALLASRATAAGGSGSPQRTDAPPPAGQVNPGSGGAGDGYWTPERLRDARPRDLPQARTPPGERNAPAPGVGRDAPSVGRGGSAGDGAVAPDPANQLVPPRQDGVTP